MSSEAIVLPDGAYSEAEQAARDVTQSNAAEYGRAGMQVGVKWGAIAELSMLLPDIELHHGVNDPVAVAVRARIADLRDGSTRHPSHGPDRWSPALRAGWEAAKQVDGRHGYPLAELFRELYRAINGGFGYGWSLLDAAKGTSDALVGEQEAGR